MQMQDYALKSNVAGTNKPVRFSLRGAAMFCGGMLLCMLMPMTGHAQSEWPEFGQNNANTANNAAETMISPSTVGTLKEKWKFKTEGDVSARAAVIGGVVYFPDWGGYLWAISATTGKAVWSKKIVNYGIEDPFTGKHYTSGVVARATPAVSDGVLYLGLQQGAWFLAIEAKNGNLLWKTRLDTVDPYAKVTASATVADGMVFAGVASDQEGVAGGEPRTAHGSVVALEASSGKLLWKTNMTPGGYTGGPVWGSGPVVDTSRGLVYVATGDNYSAPTDPAYTSCIADGGTPAACQSADNHADSVVALNMHNGTVKWARRLETWPEDPTQSGSDFYNLACPHGVAGCPTPAGPDFDFGSGPNEITYSSSRGSTTIIGAGQKSGIYYALDPDSGALLWQTQVGPGSKIGGIQWGSASDGQRIYVGITNHNEIAYAGGKAGSWAALNPATGSILWQVPDPFGAMGMGPVTVANGVVYVPSTAGAATDRNMIALDAATGETLWSFASGASTIAGATVVNGVVYWGSGYSHLPITGFTGGNRSFYAFSLHGK